MLKRTFTYPTFDGRTVTDTYYFNLTKAEVTKLVTQNGDYTLDKLLMKMTEESRAKDLINEFDTIIKISVGRISEDGKRFVKNESVTNEFLQTEAYSELFMELISDGKKAAEFIKAIIPSDLSKEIETVFRDNPEGIPDELKDYIPDNITVAFGAGANA